MPTERPSCGERDVDSSICTFALLFLLFRFALLPFWYWLQIKRRQPVFTTDLCLGVVLTLGLAFSRTLLPVLLF